MKKLYLFPVRYPFTENVECFLSDEIPYLCKEFEKIIIVPLKKEVPDAKKLPSKCTIVGPIFQNKIAFLLRGIFNHRSSLDMIADMFREGVWHDFKKLKIWVVGYVTINSLLNSKIIRKIEKEVDGNDVCYFYWGKWSNILAYYWRDKAKFVSRFHGWGDLWEADYNEYFPLRKKVANSLSYAVHISSIGEQYFKQKYPDCATIIGRLGSFDQGTSIPSDSKTISIVSCSSLWPLKRVDLIMKSAAFMSSKYRIPVNWTHIGGAGDELRVLEQISQKHKNDLFSYHLMGALKHEDVLSCYVSGTYDIFVNLSTTEGVPVSIMEAISCGIPVVATKVGGTADVVKQGISGELVSANPSIEEIVEVLFNVYKNKNLYNPRMYWNEHYNADVNYTAFASFLCSI